MKIYRLAVAEYLYSQDMPTRSIAEATLLGSDFTPGTKGWYFFNRLKSDKPGLGGGTKVLKELLAKIDSAGIPLLNQVNAYGNLSQEDLISFYKKHGFVRLNDEYGDDLLVYYPPGYTK